MLCQSASEETEKEVTSAEQQRWQLPAPVAQQKQENEQPLSNQLSQNHGKQEKVYSNQEVADSRKN